MIYLLVIFLPPVAVLLVGKPTQAILNFFLTMLLWVPGFIHAIFVINEVKADKQMTSRVKVQSKVNHKSSKTILQCEECEKYLKAEEAILGSEGSFCNVECEIKYLLNKYGGTPLL